MEPGTRLGPYEILEQLGAGGMGEVWLAQDTRLGRKVAIKVLSAEHVADRELLARFKYEAQAAAALNHPNIAAIHDVGQDGSTHYIVQEYLAGKTLRDLLDEEEFDPSRVLHVATSIAAALAAAHAAGIVHRDIKPENILVGPDDHVKVLDFGLAKDLQSSGVSDDGATALTRAGAVMGTVPYMSPERLRGLAADARCDVFSLGIVLYELLAGVHPFRRATAIDTVTAILNDEPAGLDTPRDALEAELASIALAMMAKEPEGRYPDAGPAHVALQALGESMLATKPFVPLGRRRSGQKLAVLLLAGTVVVAVVGNWFRSTEAPAAGSDPVATVTHRIAVVPFDDRTDNRELSSLTELIAQEVTAKLGQEAWLETVPLDEVRGVLAASANSEANANLDLEKLSAELDAGMFVSGSVYQIGNRVRLQVRLTRVGDWVYEFPPVEQPVDDAVGMLDQVGDMVAVAAALSQSNYYSDPRLRTQPTAEAWREHRAGLETYIRDRAVSIEHFRRAVELDPDFWGAQIYVWESYWTTGQMEKAWEVLELLESYKARFTGWENIMTDAFRQVMLRTDQEEELALWRRTLASAPAATNVRYFVISSEIQSGKYQAALDTAALLQPSEFPWDGWYDASLLEAANAMHMVGRYEDELEIAVNESSPQWHRVRARSLAAQERLADLEALAASVDGTAAYPTVVATAASELRAHGSVEESIRWGERMLQWARNGASDDTVFFWLYFTGQWEEAAEVFQQLTVPPPAPATVAETRQLLHYWGRRGTLAARLGDVAGVQAAAERLEAHQGRFLWGNGSRWLARIHAISGDAVAAVASLQRALDQGLSRGTWLHTDIDFESLRGLPEFDRLQ